MHQRKIQLIAGTTYTVSLPKNWIKMHNVLPKSSVFIDEKEDGSLVVTPYGGASAAGTDSISINIDNQEDNISHILFAAYYMGIETIRLFSKKEISPFARNKIKNTIQNLSGVEIVFEDMGKMDIKVLLDASKTNLNQLLFRMNILLKSCIDILISDGSHDDLLRNEDEIDRIHHLITKMIFISSKDLNMLRSSGINNISHILSYSIINKKLENIADRLTDLSMHVLEQGNKPDKMKKYLGFFSERLSRDMSLLLKGNMPAAHAKDMTEMGKIEDDLQTIKDVHIRLHLSNIGHSIIDMEEEMMNLLYYRKLLEEGAR